MYRGSALCIIGHTALLALRYNKSIHKIFCDVQKKIPEDDAQIHSKLLQVLPSSIDP